MKIVLLCLYFGKLPNHMLYFLKTCERNANIDWLIYADDVSFNDYAPPNVSIVNTPFEEIKDKIQRKFDFEISLDRPYKLCDFRPAFGEIFENEICGYDFWGHCDIDVLFGNTQKFLPDQLLHDYGKIFLNGCFSIYRNDQRINEAYRYDYVIEKYKLDISYRSIFSSPESWCFDEKNGLFDIHMIFDRLILASVQIDVYSAT